METQLTLNQEVLITIKSIGINGEGVGFYKRQAVFVSGVIPPEEVVVRITNLKPGYAEGEVIRIKKKAFYRVKSYRQGDPQCPNCQLDHVAYEEQQRLKEDLLKQTFERFTDLDLKKVKFHHFNPIVTPKHYLKTVVMAVEDTPDGLVTVMPKKDKTVEVMECPLHDQVINETNRMVLDILDKNDIFAFNEKTKKGLLRHLVTRRSFATGEIQITLGITIFNKALRNAANEILNLSNVSSVAISKIHDVKDKAIFGDTIEILAGNQTIEERLGEVRFRLRPDAYYQKNPQEAQNMYEYIKTLFTEDDKALLDLYTGSGTMALYYGSLFETVVGVDHDKASIESAKESAKLNHFDHVSFMLGDVVETYQKLHAQKKTFDVVIFDPQRPGLHKGLVTHLLKRPVKKLIYVSNNPSTLAKDIKALSKVYDLVSVMPFDMHPQTIHIESVALLKRRT